MIGWLDGKAWLAAIGGVIGSAAVTGAIYVALRVADAIGRAR